MRLLDLARQDLAGLDLGGMDLGGLDVDGAGWETHTSGLEQFVYSPSRRDCC